MAVVKPKLYWKSWKTGIGRRRADYFVGGGGAPTNFHRRRRRGRNTGGGGAAGAARTSTDHVGGLRNNGMYGRTYLHCNRHCSETARPISMLVGAWHSQMDLDALSDSEEIMSLHYLFIYCLFVCIRHLAHRQDKQCRKHNNNHKLTSTAHWTKKKKKKIKK